MRSPLRTKVWSTSFLALLAVAPASARFVIDEDDDKSEESADEAKDEKGEKDEEEELRWFAAVGGDDPHRRRAGAGGAIEQVPIDPGARGAARDRDVTAIVQRELDCLAQALGVGGVDGRALAGDWLL